MEKLFTVARTSMLQADPVSTAYGSIPGPQSQVLSLADLRLRKTVQRSSRETDRDGLRRGAAVLRGGLG